VKVVILRIEIQARDLPNIEG